MSNIGAITDHIETVIFDLEDVSVMDVTGLVAFESAVNRLTRHGKLVLLAGLKSQPKELLTKARMIGGDRENVRAVKTIDDAVADAESALATKSSRRRD